MSDPQLSNSQVLDPTIRIVISQSPSATDPTVSLQGSRWRTLKDALEVVAKLLPALTLIFVVLFFKTEVSEFLRNASKVELFGFRLEKGEFDKRLFASAEKLNGPKNNPAWTDVPFRKLKLAASALKGMSILWVDDHPENNFYLRRILGDLGVQISVALNNAEALDAIKRKDFDLIVSDFNRDAPLKETGAEFVLKVTVMAYDAPAIFYTSRPDSVPANVPHIEATNDPSVLLATVAEVAIARVP